MVDRIIEERTTEPVVIHERDQDTHKSGSKTGLIIAIIVIILLLILVFGRGLFSGSSSTPSMNVAPSRSGAQ